MGLPEQDAAPSKRFREDFGPFVLTARLAVGGAGEVFLARPKNGRLPAPTLVIKRSRKKSSGHYDFASLSREAELNELVQHENVVKVYGAGMVRDVPYIAMEHVPGVDLHKLLHRARAEQRPIPSKVAVLIATKIAHALACVHTAADDEGTPLRLVHGDVTPSNVYLSRAGGVKLGDFGIARTLTDASELAQDTSTSGERRSVPGKFGYIAPEQLNADDYDHRADLFSLAILLGELVSGGPVFAGKGKLALLLSVRDANIAPLRAMRRYMPDGLFEILERGLQKSPAARYPDARSFAQALEPFLGDPAQDEMVLAELVQWAEDAKAFAAQLEEQLHNSRHSRLASGSGARAISTRVRSSRPSAVRRRDMMLYQGLPFSKLVELIARGVLHASDEVSLAGAPFSRLSDIEELSPHLSPSTGNTTERMYEPGTPDYAVELEDVCAVEVLARMRRARESGALFASRIDAQGRCHRRDIYLRQGRLYHVEAASTADRLGPYLVRKGFVSADQLKHALREMTKFGGHLGDTLIGLELLDAIDVFRAIRNLGRDRVAGLCGWTSGNVQFYRGGAPGKVHFPLDLDLSVVMMAGIMTTNPSTTSLASENVLLTQAGSAPSSTDREELASVPLSLQLVPALARRSMAVTTAIQEIVHYLPEHAERRPTEREAAAAILTAEALNWIELLPSES